MKHNVLGKIFALSLCAAMVSYFSSCNTGLGEKVDTARPTVEITYPPTSAIIRSAFVVEGTASDDRTISSVTVTLKNSEDSSKEYKYSATVGSLENGKVNWKLEVDPVKDGILDGSYTVTAVSSDGLQDSTEYPRLVEIDNTAPVFILRTPSTTGASITPKGYGRDFKIAGELSDDHNVQKMKVTVYDKATLAQLGEFTFEDNNFADIMKDESYTVARFYTAAEIEALKDDAVKQAEAAKLKENYIAIYGDIDEANIPNESKEFYFTIAFADNAKLYRGTSEDSSSAVTMEASENVVSDAEKSETAQTLSESDDGNWNTVYYVRTSTSYTEIFKENNASVIRDVLNGSSSLSSAEQESLKEKIKAYTVENTINQNSSSNFSVNPHNNPSFSVTGYTLGVNTGTNIEYGRKLYSGGPITIGFYPGADSVEIDSESISIELVEYSNGSVEDGSGAEKVTGEKALYLELVKKGDLTDGADESGKYTYTVTEEQMASILEPNRNFKFEIQATDLDGSIAYSEAASGYGFRVQSTSEKPVFTEHILYKGTDRITENTGVISGDDLINTTDTQGIFIKSTVTVDADGMIEKADGKNPFEVTVSVSSAEDVETVLKEVTFYPDAVPVSETQRENDYGFSLYLKAADLGYNEEDNFLKTPDLYIIKVSITAMDSNQGASTSTKSYYIDNKNPEITSISVEPVAQSTNAEDKNSYYNGKITITGIMNDNNALKNTKITLTATNGDSQVADFNVVEEKGSNVRWSVEFDTTNVALDEYTLNIKIESVDTAGNSIENTTSYSVNQTFDAPYFDFTDGDVTKTTADSLANGAVNVFTAGQTIRGTLRDDDGINKDSIKVWYKKYDSSNAAETPSAEAGWTEAVITNSPVQGATTGTLSFTMPEEEGQYDIRILCNDTKNETKYASMQVHFVSAVDSGAPSISFTDANEYYNTNSFTLNGTWSEGSGAPVIVATPADTEGVAVGTITIKEDGTWSVPVTVSDGKHTVVFTATDFYGNKSSNAEFVFTSDTVKPVLVTNGSNAIKIGGTAYNVESLNWYKTTSLSVSGEYTDDTSGIARVYYWVSYPGRENANVPTNLNTDGNYDGVYDVAEGKSTFAVTIDSFRINEGEKGNTLYIQGEDRAGNLSERKMYTINVDAEGPEFAGTYYTFDETPSASSIYASASGTVLTNGENIMTVYGTFSDGASGIKELTFTSNGTEIAAENVAVTYSTSDDTSTDWSTVIGRTYETYNAENKSSYKYWKAVFQKAAFSGSEVYVIKAKVSDTAENSSEQQLFTLNIDDDSPVITLNNSVLTKLVAASVKVNGNVSTATTGLNGAGTDVRSLNGNVSFAGNTTDSNTVSSVKVYYSTNNSTATTGDTLIEEFTGQGVYTWSKDYEVSNGLDMKVLGKYTGINGTAYLKIVAADSAANESVYVYQYTIDPNSDRPTFNVTNLNSSTDILKYATVLEGSVIDDDEINANCVLKVYEVTETQNSAPTTSEGWASFTQAASGNGSVTFNTSAGDWTYTPLSETDGDRTLYFYFKDSGGTEFWTSYSSNGNSDVQNKVNMPKIAYKRQNETDSTSAFVYKTDGASPAITSVEMQYSSDNSTWSEWVSSGNIFGGKDRKFVKFRVKARDDNGIASVTAVFGENKNVKFTKDSTNSTATAEVFESEGTFDLSTYSGTTSAEIVITATDTSGLYSNNTTTFTVDNEVNAQNGITLTSPIFANGTSSDVLTGDVTLIGAANDGSGIGVASDKEGIGWTILKSSETQPSETSTWNYVRTESSTVSAWSFAFDAADGNGPQFTEITQNASNYGITPDGVVYEIPVYFRLKDQLGNVGYAGPYKVRYNPYLDWPTASVIYPTGAIVDDTVETSVGGTVRITGSAVDNQTTVSKVYIQLEASGNTTPTWTAPTSDSIYGKTVVKSITGTTVDSVSIKGYPTTAGSGFDTNTMNWGIEANGTQSWYLELDTSQIQAGQNLFIRAVAVDDTANMGVWSDYQVVKIDSDVPTVGDDKTHIAIFSNTAGSSGTETSSVTYTADSYISSKDGKWYLVVNATDDSGIKTVNVQEGIGANAAASIMTHEFANESSTATYTDSATGIIVESKSLYTGTINTTGRTHLDKTIYIPINTESDGYRTYRIIVTEAAEAAKTGTGVYTFNVDNTAPQLSTLTSEDVSADIKSNSVAGNKLQNSNGSTTFGSTIVDTGSGFEKLAFYFKRGNTIYNPYPTGSENGWTGQSAPSVTTSDSGITHEYAESSANGLYGWSATAALSEDGKLTNISGTNLPSDGKIRAGGLARVNGKFYRIASVSSTSEVTLAGTGFVAATNASVFFPFALAVKYESSIVTRESFTNNTSYASASYTINEDDNDGILQYVQKSGSSYTWTVSVDSSAIPDGEIEIVCLALDAAGNITEMSTKTMISNNAPRISKVYLATDLNYDNTYSEDEFALPEIRLDGTQGNSYGISALAASGDVQKVVELDTEYEYLDGDATATGRFSVRNGFTLAAEFVTSGSSDMYVLPKLMTASSEDPQTGVTVEETDKMTAFTTTTNITGSSLKSVKYDNSKFTSMTGYVNSMEYNSTSDNTAPVTYLQLTVWDTVNKTQTTNVATADTFGADGLISEYGNQYTILNIPFILDIADEKVPESSIDALSADESRLVVKEGEEVKFILGHIEPKSSAATATVDEVSGQIIYTGTVSDNAYVNTLSVTGLPGESGAVTVATYSTEKGGFEFKSDYSSTNYTSSSKAWYIEKTSETFTQQDGHTVEWKLVLDTSLYTNVAQNSVVLKVTAKDANSSNAAADASNTMNVVPYITEITGGTNELFRSKFGEYSVLKGNSLTVKGFNFASGAAVKVGNTTVSPTSITPSTKAAQDENGFASIVVMTIPATSGELTVTVNNIVNSNSTNDNSLDTNQEINSENASQNYYDNRYLRVWDSGHFFKDTGSSAHKPVMTAGNDGTLYASWTRMGDGQLRVQRGIANDSVRVMQHYDQPAEYSAISVSTVSGTTRVSTLNFNENVGDGGIMVNNGFSAVSNVGGAWGISIPVTNNALSVTSGTADGASKGAVVISGNPLTTLDSNYGTSGYSLSSYAMIRDVGVFSTPRTVSNGKDMHFAYYNTKDQSLRYQYVESEESTSTHKRDENFTSKSWVLIDGTSMGYDRKHDSSMSMSTKTTPDYGKGTYDIPLEYSSISNSTVTVKTDFSSKNIAKDDSIALIYTQNNQIGTSIHKITSVDTSQKMITFEGTFPYEGSTIQGITVYKGESAVVSSGATQSSAAGSYIGMDVTSSGSPVIVYSDTANGKLRIAYMTGTSTNGSNSTTYTTKFENPANWKRVEVADGGTHCDIKIDSSNNLHIIYRSSYGNLMYVKGTPSGSDYTFGTPVTVDDDTSGTYGKISLLNNTTPVIAYLNSEEAANGVKFAILREVDKGASTKEDEFDVMVVPPVSGHYVVGSNLVNVEANNGSWSVTEDSVQMNTCDAVVGWESTRLNAAFLLKTITNTN